MALDTETLGKLTAGLAGDIDLYNKIINELQASTAQIEEKSKEVEGYKKKVEEAENRSGEYLKQISNLLSKIPVGNSSLPQTFEQKVEEIKKQAWKK